MPWDYRQDVYRCRFQAGGQGFLPSYFLELRIIPTPPRFLCFNSGDKWYTSQNDHFWFVSGDTILQWFKSKWGNKNTLCLSFLRYEMIIIWPSLSLVGLYQQPPNWSPCLRVLLQSTFYVTRIIFLKYKVIKSFPSLTMPCDSPVCSEKKKKIPCQKQGSMTLEEDQGFGG